jgi:putative oxidoreductase
MLTRFLKANTDNAYALMRVVAGLMFSFHGMQKIFGVLSQHQTTIGTQVWFGGLIELVTGVAIALGWMTPWAAFLASGTMAVAYVQFHWKLDFGSNFLPALNKGELALLYAVVFLFMACKGSGKCSLDAHRQRRASPATL